MKTRFLNSGLEKIYTTLVVCNKMVTRVNVPTYCPAIFYQGIGDGEHGRKCRKMHETQI